MLYYPTNTEDVQRFVREAERVVVQGGGTKPALSQPANLAMSQLAGVVQYDPAEYTITALAGTRVSAIRTLLAQQQQFLPFDPILVEAGATLGGTVAAGLSGAGRYRFGGVRDFLLGVRMVNGEGDVVRGGGIVVKNAAGFDIPKLLVGSLGRFGVLVEMTFKVFPRPQSSSTLRKTCSNLQDAVAALSRVAGSPAEVSALDLIPPSQLLIRISGMADAQHPRIALIDDMIGGGSEVVAAEQDEATWADACEMRWVPADHQLVKIPLVPGQIAECEALLAQQPAGPRRYSVGGNVLWLAWPADQDLQQLDAALRALGRPALVVTGSCHTPCRNVPPASVFEERLSSVFDPHGKFTLSV